MLDIRGFSCDHELGQTIHFSEKVRKNHLKLMDTFFQSELTQHLPFASLSRFVQESIKKLNEPIPLNEQQQPTISQKQKSMENEK